MHPSIHPSMHPIIYESMHHPSNHTSMNPCIRLPIYPCHPSIHLFNYTSMKLCIIHLPTLPSFLPKKTWGSWTEGINLGEKTLGGLASSVSSFSFRVRPKSKFLRGGACQPSFHTIGPHAPIHPSTHPPTHSLLHLITRHSARGWE